SRRSACFPVLRLPPCCFGRYWPPGRSPCARLMAGKASLSHRLSLTWPPDQINPARQELRRRIPTNLTTRPIGEACGQTPGQSDHPVRGAEQQRAGIRGDAPTVKRRHHGAAFHPCKIKQLEVTLCRHRGRPLLSDKTLLQRNFRRTEAPMHSPSVRYAG